MRAFPIAIAIALVGSTLAVAPGAGRAQAYPAAQYSAAVTRICTGALLFDRDGTGSTYKAVQFATLENHAAITAADFVVV